MIGLPQSPQSSSWSHPVCCLICTWGSLPGAKAAGKRSITAEVKVFWECNATLQYVSMAYSGTTLAFMYASMYLMRNQFQDLVFLMVRCVTCVTAPDIMMGRQGILTQLYSVTSEKNRILNINVETPKHSLTSCTLLLLYFKMKQSCNRT